ncbi:MAG: hypothetical protein JST59_20495 [Actinobacteria bacterium]|nr:hypothetical protein [Actinomycetota bacterium]
MNAREIERVLAAADPLGREEREALGRLDFEAMETDLLAAVEDEPAGAPYEPRPPRRRPPRLALAGAAVAVAAAIALAIILVGTGSQRSSRAYGAELIRFAESTPLLLLEAPGWRVQNLDEYKRREGTEGQMEFITGKPLPRVSMTVHGNIEEGQHVEGLQPAVERQRLVNLGWRDLREESLAYAIHWLGRRVHPHGRHLVRLPVAGTTAVVDTRAEVFVNQGGPGDREMVAIWSEGGYLLRMQAAVPNLAAMRERLDWITKVDSQTWLEAMPAKIVKAADFEGTVKEMLKGVAVPKTFDLSLIPNEGLTTSRDQVRGTVVNTVACLWFRQWGAASRTGDAAARTEAERAMADSRQWPILRREAAEPRAATPFIWELADEMRRGYWDFRGHHRNLLSHAESLGCARLGLPVKPEKQRRRRERRVPPPPD